MRSRLALPFAIVIALAITPTLAGCFGNPVESIIEGATGGDVDLGGAEIPEGYPVDAVPIIDGEILFGMGLGNDGAKAWNVTVRVGGVTAIDDIKAQLLAAGFAESDAPVSGATEAGATVVLESAYYGVLVVVSKGGDNGYVANYTVTQKE